MGGIATKRFLITHLLISTNVRNEGRQRKTHEEKVDLSKEETKGRLRQRGSQEHLKESQVKSGEGKTLIDGNKFKKTTGYTVQRH